MRRIPAVFLCVALATLAATGCKKKGGTGGGGGWFVGQEGLMVNVDPNGLLGEGYDLGATERLNAIACRYLDEAWVVGAGGTLLYTSDAGASWEAQDLGTGADLRALGTQDAGPVFVAGDGVFFAATPDYRTGQAQWSQLGDGATNFRSLAAAQRATDVLALDDAGGVWSYADGRLTQRATLPGAASVAISADGTLAIAVGQGVHRSFDGGKTWSPLAVDANLSFESVRIDDRGDAVAVGAAGAIARIDAEGRVLVQHVGTEKLRALHIPTYDDVGYAAGDGGQIWMTRDAGWTWTAGPNVGRTVLSVDEIGDGHN